MQYIEIPIAYAGPNVIVNGKSDLCLYGWSGLVYYLLNELSLYEINSEAKIVLNKESIVFVWNKEKLYKKGYLGGSLVAYFYDKLNKLNLGIKYKLLPSLKNEKIYLEIKFKKLTKSEEDTLLGLLRIKGIVYTVKDLKDWFMRAMGIYPMRYISSAFGTYMHLTSTNFPRLYNITDEGDIKVKINGK